jgi:hypothetical protein
MSYAFSLVGVLMFLGGAALFVTQLRDGLAAPAAPVETDVAHLLERVRAGATWVRITDAIEPCALPPFATDETSLVYGPVWDASGRFVALTSTRDGRQCHDAPQPLTATVERMSLEAFIGAPEFVAYARPFVGDELVLLTTDLDPRLSISGLCLIGSFALLGLVIAWFYAASASPARGAKRLPMREFISEGALLPKRPLHFARGSRSAVLLGFAFMSICTVFFASITASMWPEGGVSALTGSDIAPLLFLAAMTLAFAALTAVLVRGAFRQTRAVDGAVEAWSRVVAYQAALAHGVDVGNRELIYQDPTTREPVSLLIGAQESSAWIVDGHVLLVRDPASGANYVMREDGGPFELTDAECAALGK